MEKRRMFRSIVCHDGEGVGGEGDWGEGDWGGVR